MGQTMLNKNSTIRQPDYVSFKRSITDILPEHRIITDELGRFVHGTDASFYRLTPELVTIVENEGEVVEICKLANRDNTPLTFRAAGTSLSGQAVTDSILVKLGRDGWRDSELLDNGQEIKLGPGLTGGQANSKLKRIHKKIGPDPASINSAMIGGIAANNSSGMCCGTKQNTYQTLKSMRIVFADGTLLDTSDDHSKAAFKKSHADIIEGLEQLSQQTKANNKLHERIKKKFSIKNTVGYSLNALIDFDDPFEILQHLMIGSEGTLGFISEITMETVDDLPCKSSAILLFDNMHTACQAVTQLEKTPISAAELMDDASLLSIADTPKLASILKDLPKHAAGLLIDIRQDNQESLEELKKQIMAALKGNEPFNKIEFSTDPETYNLYWSIRNGLFPKVGAVRQAGTTVIIEDVAVEIDKLADCVVQLHDLFEKHGYDEAIIFGHALAGNLHFAFAQAFNTQAEIDQYANFMDDLSDLIVGRYDGSLKAEHSTGRNMAPFVEMEWGRDAYRLMWDIKALFDPKNILNPDVILTKNDQLHVQDLKQLAAVDPVIDKCIECGFCEASCPTRASTLTPRQRIASLRELSRLENIQDNKQKAELEEAFQYQGIDSCAGDGLCQISCPVDIDTGQMMRQLRHDAHGDLSKKTARFIGNHFAAVCNVARIGLSFAVLMKTVIGKRAMQGLVQVAHKLSGGFIPPWVHDIARPQSPFVTKCPVKGKETVVYFSSCASRVMGNSTSQDDKRPLSHVIESLFNKAGYNLIQPKAVESLCCGMPFESKGFFDVADQKTQQLYQAIKTASNDGEYPIIFDTSPCTLRLQRQLQAEFKIYDITEAIHDLILDKVSIKQSDEPVALHITCSAQRLGLSEKLKRIMETCSSHVISPENIHCCGFSGDKGFTLPELNANALRNLKKQLPKDCKQGYSTSRTCEIGLSTHSERPYHSIAYLVDNCSQSR